LAATRCRGGCERASLGRASRAHASAISRAQHGCQFQVPLLKPCIGAPDHFAARNPNERESRNRPTKDHSPSISWPALIGKLSIVKTLVATTVLRLRTETYAFEGPLIVLCQRRGPALRRISVHLELGYCLFWRQPLNAGSVELDGFPLKTFGQGARRRLGSALAFGYADASFRTLSQHRGRIGKSGARRPKFCLECPPAWTSVMPRSGDIR
jgi:hypothetical protein